jgi:2-isopropylmalate synthase
MIEIYDCTLREGEQAAGASFSFENRIELFKKLDKFGVDFIELGWPHASKEIFDAFEKCKKIAKKSKIAAFGSTSINSEVEKDENLKSIIKCGTEYACIFGKTSLEHVKKQLKIAPEENLRKIKESILFLRKNNINVFYDAEHYFDGFKENKEYALQTLIEASIAGAERLILCDTNGGSLPKEAEKIIKETREFLKNKKINACLGVHFHNDCDLAVANTLVCLPYINQVQGTINGIGERVGNLDFSSFLPIYTKKLNKKLNFDLKELKELNEEAYKLSGIEISEKKPFVGETAFAHKGGIHIDANNKGASYEHVSPEDFGNRSLTILNTLGGKSAVISVAEEFGYNLDKKDSKTIEKINKLFEELKEYENKGYRMGTIKAEQFLLIEKYFGNLKEFFKILEWEIKTSYNNGEEESIFSVECRFDNGEVVEEELETSGGPIDAAYKTLKNLIRKKYSEINELELIDFHVSIARCEKEESSVRTKITFKDKEEFEIAGVDSNIIQSAIEAIEKGFRYWLNKKYNKE